MKKQNLEQAKIIAEKIEEIEQEIKKCKYVLLENVVPRVSFLSHSNNEECNILTIPSEFFKTIGTALLTHYEGRLRSLEAQLESL